MLVGADCIRSQALWRTLALAMCWSGLCPRQQSTWLGVSVHRTARCAHAFLRSSSCRGGRARAFRGSRARGTTSEDHCVESVQRETGVWESEQASRRGSTAAVFRPPVMKTRYCSTGSLPFLLFPTCKLKNSEFETEPGVDC